MNFSTDANSIQQRRQKFEERCTVVSESAASLFFLQGSLVLSELIMNATFCLLLLVKSGIGLALGDWLGVAPGTLWEVDERIIRASRGGDTSARNCYLV